MCRMANPVWHLQSSYSDESDPQNFSSLPCPVGKPKRCCVCGFTDTIEVSDLDRDLRQKANLRRRRVRDRIKLTRPNNIHAVIIFLDSSLLLCVPNSVAILIVGYIQTSAHSQLYLAPLQNGCLPHPGTRSNMVWQATLNSNAICCAMTTQTILGSSCK